MKGETMNSSYVELHVPNFQKAKDFYEALGFSVVWEREPEAEKGYLVLRRETNIICFWGGNEKIFDHLYFKKLSPKTHRGYGVEIVMIMSDFDEFYERAKKIAHVVEDLQLRPWGLRDFRIEDPFGFYIRFTEPHDILDPGNAVK